MHMDKISVKRKPFIVGVMGSHESDSVMVKDALCLGQEIARRGYVLLTGGGPGIMQAASEGAYSRGGLVIAILPSERKRPLKDYPNKFIDIPIYTGMYDARNIINAKTPHVLIAISGGLGTLSEIAVALKSGIPVVSLHAPYFEKPDTHLYTATHSVAEALQALDRIIEKNKHNEEEISC